jgi:hypothetical protein
LRAPLVLAAVIVALASGRSSALAVEARFAVVIGNNGGLAEEPTLRYAESDARRIARILIEIGGFAPDQTTLLQGRSVDDVRKALREARDRLESAAEDGLLLVYYSGHADGDSLHLAGSRLPLDELRSLVRERAIATRIMIIDACRSGALTAVKGAHPGQSFEVRLAPGDDPHGLAIITSSAAGEESQESPQLQASFFTHHFATGLLGAADRDGDGDVTIAEAYAYAAGHTVAATSATWAGPQHPTYNLDLGGRHELVLTHPGGGAGSGRAVGHLTLGRPGWYFIRRQSDGSLVAEVTGDDAEHPLALAPGQYEVLQRAGDHLMVGDYTVVQASNTEVDDRRMTRVDFGRVIRKGGSTRTRAVGVFANAGVRGPLMSLGTGASTGLGARVDIRPVTVVALADWAQSSTNNQLGSRLETTELGFKVLALRAIDFPKLTIAAGAEGGVSRLAQTSTDQLPATRSYAPLLGPAVLLEIPVWRRFFAWLQAEAPAYLVDAAGPDRSGSTYHIAITYRASLALGGYF